MKILKIVLFLFIGLALIGCDTKPIDDIDDNDDEIVEPTLKIQNSEYLIKEEDTFQLEVQVEGTDEELGIIYISSNNLIASVSTTGLVTGVAPGVATITAIISSYPDQKLNVTITVEAKTPDDILDAMDDFAAIKAEFTANIPDVVTKDIRLENYKYFRFITWTSSNEDAISRFGIVTRGDVDVQVTLRAEMKYKTISEVWEKVVTVPKTQPRDLSNKKIVFAYAMATNIKIEHLQQIDVVNYSFASIGSNNTFNVTSQIATLVRQAHNEGTRVTAAVGGGSAAGSDPFGVMTATAETRKTFIDSMMIAIDKYDLDGIDYDWEVPTTAQKNNFSALVRETKAAFDASGKDLILTAAVSAGTWHIGQGYDVAELNKYLSFFHVMTYDLNNWSSPAPARHHTHLYRSSIAPSLSADEAIRAYMNAGASPEKLVLGVAAYGRVADVIGTTENGLNQMANNPAQSMKFDEIYQRYYKDPTNSEYTLYWDDVAKASWLYSDTLTVKNFISFDDERSIEAKANYVYEKNLGGAMYWDYSNDSNGIILGFIDKYVNN